MNIIKSHNFVFFCLGEINGFSAINLMDLWNNQVGRELANNAAFKNMTEDELFDFAEKHNLLIIDANKTYDFLGITDFITDASNYTVDVEWNLTTGNVTVKKDGKAVQLKIGI